MSAHVLRNPARFLLGSAIDPAPQGVGNGGDVGHGMIALPQDSQAGSRYRWVWSTIKLMAAVGVITLAAMMLQRFARLPHSRAFYEELLDIVRRFKTNTLT